VGKKKNSLLGKSLPGKEKKISKQNGEPSSRLLDCAQVKKNLKTNKKGMTLRIHTENYISGTVEVTPRSSWHSHKYEGKGTYIPKGGSGGQGEVDKTK